jgi:predicted RNA-binding Zn-ribbon protein involved in translation (DUF1610 family)
MAGIPAKCLACGADLRYEATKLIYHCPVCEPIAVVAAEEGRDVRKEAA